MAVKRTNTAVYATISKEQKKKLARVANSNHRSVSGEVAHAIALYLLGYNDDGTPVIKNRPIDLPY